MSEQLRHSKILSYLETAGQITVEDLVAHFDISPSTARRDINKLSKEGQLHKVRGGAIALKTSVEPITPQPTVAFMSAPEDAIDHEDEKDRIANAAAQLCKESDRVIINCGTTAFMMGSKLTGRDIQVITNYIPLANQLITAKHEKVIILGGQYYAGSGSTMTLFDGDAQFYSAHYMFTSGSGLTEQGLTKVDPMTIMAEQKMMKQTKKVVVLVDSRKIGVCNGLLFCQASDIDIVITGKEANPEVLKQLELKGIQIFLV